MRLVGLCLLLAACGDNIVPGSSRLVITAGDALRTTEGGGTAMFTVSFEPPLEDAITIALTSSKPTEGTVAPSMMSVGKADSAGLLVTVTGVDDSEIDGHQPYQIHVDAGVMGSADVAITNEDDEGSGSATVTPTTGTTTEAGGTATFSVVLTSAPMSSVTIPLSSSNPSEGTLSTNQLSFTTTNWNVPQMVTVTGQDDDLDDGDKAYNAILGPVSSSDPRFSGMNPADVALTNTDDDARGFSVGAISGPTNESGTSATFTVALTSEPTADVTFTLTAMDATEGQVSPTTITFTAANWNAPRQVTVTGVDDVIADGDVTYPIILSPATSLDVGYAGIDPADVMVTNEDNETVGIDVTAPANGLVTTESGGQDSFTIVLRSQPTGPVTIPVMSNDATEGLTQVASVTFTTLDWNAPQEVFVTGVDDVIADGPIAYTVLVGAATSTDLSYNGFDPADVPATNIDNDSASATVTPQTLTTSETGTSAVFTVVLNSQPAANVTIPIVSADPSEGTVTPSSLTFTPGDWFMAQSVTVTGVDDLVTDGNQVYLVEVRPATSADAAYNGVDGADVSVTNLDNETAGIIVDPTELFVSEFGDTDTFTIVLANMPMGTVTIPLQSSDTTEGTFVPPTLTSVTFTPLDWNIPQTITVRGADDNDPDGNIVFSIITGPAVSSDPAYNGVNAADVTVTNFDNETANVFVQARKTLSTDEGGGPSGSATFRVRLTTNPTSPVTCTLSSNDTTEGQVSPQTLVLNNTNFQTVTVTGIDDAVVDGDVQYFIITAPCTSADPQYDQRNPRDVGVINRDND